MMRNHEILGIFTQHQMGAQSAEPAVSVCKREEIQIESTLPTQIEMVPNLCKELQHDLKCEKLQLILARWNKLKK